MPGTVTTVVGAQFGSEGKGVIINAIANKYDVHVRTGGPNAGHSFYYNDEVFKMQVVPCGWTHPDAQLVIGAGALVDLKQLKKELKWIKTATGNDPRLIIDRNAGVLTPEHHAHEGGIQGEMHQRFGSTGEGVGTARKARIDRDPATFYMIKDAAEMEQYDWLNRFSLVDTMDYLHRMWGSGAHILLEGTQGSGLSLWHGIWPFVTSNDTNSAQLCADSGIPPQNVTECILVARTHPIRVAGPSGPLKGEMSWDEMSKFLGKKVEEKTTVTLKPRRIGEWDERLFVRSCKLNNPTAIALTFVDYMFPHDEGKDDINNLSPSTHSFIKYVETIADCPVKYIGTGGHQWHVIQA